MVITSTISRTMIATCMRLRVCVRLATLFSARSSAHRSTLIVSIGAMACGIMACPRGTAHSRRTTVRTFFLLEHMELGNIVCMQLKFHGVAAGCNLLRSVFRAHDCVAEVARFFHVLLQFEPFFTGVARCRDGHFNLLFLIQLGPDGNEMHSRWHERLHIGKNLAPRKRFHLNQAVHESRAIARASLFRTVQNRLCLVSYVIQVVHLLMDAC